MDDELRREFRRFVRQHHPDVGGDPHVFTAGVARYRRRLRPGIDPDDPRLRCEIVFYRRRSGPASLVDAVVRLRQSRRRPRRVL
ncbi:MAG: hypothetical protein ACR2JQ_02920 [Mycobacteriales bacterium]